MEPVKYQSSTKSSGICLLIALVVLAIKLLPITLIALAVFGLVMACRKCKKECQERRKERRARKLLENNDDTESGKPLGMIVLRVNVNVVMLFPILSLINFFTLIILSCEL